RLDAVAMVNVDVDVPHPLATVLQQPTDGNGYVVVDAEAARIARHCVMQSAADIAGALCVPAPHSASCLDACHRDRGRDLMHPWEDWIVAGSEPVRLVGLPAL